MSEDGRMEMAAGGSRGTEDKSPGAVETEKVRKLLNGLVESGGIAVDPKQFDALVDDIVDLEVTGPGAARRIYALLMEHQAVEEVFIAQDELLLP